MREVMEKSISHMRNPKLIIDAVLQGLEEAGYVIVPKEPTGIYEQLTPEQRERAKNVDLHPSVCKTNQEQPE